VVALWCHRCKLKLNLHLRNQHYVRVECSGRRRRGNIQSCVGYWLRFVLTGVVLCKSHYVEMVQDAGSVFNMGGNVKGGTNGKKGFMYSSFCDCLVQLVRYESFHSDSAFCWLINTKRHSLHLAQPPGTS